MLYLKSKPESGGWPEHTAQLAGRVVSQRPAKTVYTKKTELEVREGRPQPISAMPARVCTETPDQFSLKNT